MSICDYPENSEILKILEAIDQLTATKDWRALTLAEDDLQFLLLNKEEWLTSRGFKMDTNSKYI